MLGKDSGHSENCTSESNRSTKISHIPSNIVVQTQPRLSTACPFEPASPQPWPCRPHFPASLAPALPALHSLGLFQELPEATPLPNAVPKADEGKRDNAYIAKLRKPSNGQAHTTPKR
ncbi:hypothetical protein KCU81_g596, partial [Aureobasidium melanogenum]